MLNGLYSALSRFLRAGVEVGSLAPDGGEGGGAEHALVPYASLTAAAVAPKVEVVGAPLPPDLRGGGGLGLDLTSAGSAVWACWWPCNL